MPDFSEFTTGTGVACAVALSLITVIRQRRFDYSDIGSVMAVFLSGCNILPSLYICYFGLASHLNSTLPPTLKGYEKYLALAGLCSFAVSVVSIRTLFKKASTVVSPK
jgi:hypothetical protein